MKWKRRIVDALGHQLIRSARSHSCIEGHLRRVLDRLGVNCVIDVGANEGQHGRLLRKLGYRGRIVSFEPVPCVYETLVRTSASDKKWFTHELALGSEETPRSMHVTSRSVLSSFLPPAEFARERFEDQANVVRTEEVKVARLDAIFDEIVHGISAPRVFLKMDTQGCDLEVFAGAQGCLGAIVGIQSELSVLPLYSGIPDYMEALPAYRQQGFEATGFYPIFREKKSLVLGELDCVMVRREGSTPAHGVGPEPASRA